MALSWMGAWRTLRPLSRRSSPLAALDKACQESSLDAMSPPPKVLLLVEDEPVIAAAEKMALQSRGYTVVVATSGEAALAAVQGSQGIDLVLMDIDLGAGWDGTETAERILACDDPP